VLLSSAAARLGSPGEYVDYAVSKGAVDTMTLGLAREVAGEGIRVNAVRAGVVRTEIHAEGGEPGRAERLGPSIPMGRAGDPHEVAHAILWLLSDEAAYVSGAIVDVTGGPVAARAVRVEHRYAHEAAGVARCTVPTFADDVRFFVDVWPTIDTTAEAAARLHGSDPGAVSTTPPMTTKDAITTLAIEPHELHAHSARIACSAKAPVTRGAVGPSTPEPDDSAKSSSMSRCTSDSNYVPAAPRRFASRQGDDGRLTCADRRTVMHRSGTCPSGGTSSMGTHGTSGFAHVHASSAHRGGLFRDSLSVHGYGQVF